MVLHYGDDSTFIVRSHCFQRFRFSSSELQVRSAFFELISAFCQYIPESMKAEASKVCPAVLLSIDDSDAIVCPALWEAVLHTLTTIEVNQEAQ